MVPIPINFNEVEIGAIPTAIHEKKIKVGMENGIRVREIDCPPHPCLLPKEERIPRRNSNSKLIFVAFKKFPKLA